MYNLSTSLFFDKNLHLRDKNVLKYFNFK